MSDLVRLLNVFCLLSLLAVGGGSAVLPEMQHETVAVHRWVTDQQFATIYSLGQMAPGPNMSMVALIGWQVAGVAGLVVVLVAFYLPPSFLVYGCSYIWDHFKENPWRRRKNRLLQPVAHAGIQSDRLRHRTRRGRDPFCETYQSRFADAARRRGGVDFFKGWMKSRIFVLTTI